jgi:hypothetical protein
MKFLSPPLADILRQRGIPFVFASGSARPELNPGFPV